MAYIEAHQSLRDHRKILALATELDMIEPHVAGHCLFLWLWSLDNAVEGILPTSERIIERAAGWIGTPGALVDAMVRVGMLDRCVNGALAIHDWWDYAGRLIDKRKADAERKRAARAQPSSSTTSPPASSPVPASGGHPTDGARTSHGRRADGAGTVPNRTLAYPSPVSLVGSEVSDVAANTRAREGDAPLEKPAAAAQVPAVPTENELQREVGEALTRWKALSQQGKARVPSATALRTTLGKHAQRGMTISDLRTEIDKLEDEAAATERPLTLARLDNWLNQWHAPPPDSRPDARPTPTRRSASAARPEPPSMIRASQASDFWNVPSPLDTADAAEPATTATTASADVLALAKHQVTPQAPPGVPTGVTAGARVGNASA